MISDDTSKPTNTPLRKAALAKLATMPSIELDTHAKNELLHELQVHQIELEMQNETLRQAQQALEESRDSYMDLYEFAPVGYLTLNEDGLIKNINLTCSILLGKERKQLLNKSLRTMIVEYDQGKWIHLFIKIKKVEVHEVIELQLQRGDGTLLHVALDCAKKVLWNNEVTIRVIMSDISERKEKENESNILREQLAQVSKMESVGQLTAGIAHDFNNILAVMLGNAELSQRSLAVNEIDRISQYQAEILKAGNRAKELIQNMLTFSRVGKLNLGKDEPVINFAAAIEDDFPLLRSTLPSTVDLGCHTETKDIKVRVEPVHLNQILINLVVNARDSMGEYGKIDIALNKQHYSYQQCDACKLMFAGDYAKLTVADSGKGISVNSLLKIFEPFFTTKDVGKGTGMGLSVVHGLVHTINGHITVESSAENGTTFNILLPLVLAEDVLAVKTNILQETGISGIRIMVVDDEESIADMMESYLTAHGAQVMAFNDPLQALEAFTRGADNIDLVITDETMSGMSGMLLAEELLALRPDLPVILCTGYSEHATPEAAEKLGIGGFFIKPLALKDLLVKIQLLCKRSDK